MPPDSVSGALLAGIRDRLRDVDAELARRYPGDRPEPQPVHTVYVSGADANGDTLSRWSESALALFDERTDVLRELADSETLRRTRSALERHAIVDLRIDFEDGYGIRADPVEDADARRAGTTLAALNALSNRGIRIKGLTSNEYTRAIRTLELVLDAAGGVPDGFVFTIPKLRVVEQVEVAVTLCAELERAHGLPAGTLRFELQIESPQAIVAADGTATVARAIGAAAGRCVGLHYGTYDYSAACGIAAQYQSLAHPVAEHAKAVMQVAAAQTGVWIADGSTQVAPVGTPTEVASALRRHFGLVTWSLERGYYQGWDMHPGHLVTRWLANIAFYRSALTAAAPRLTAYLERRTSGVVDEPATAEALARVVLRGLACGAFDDVPEFGRTVLADLVARRRPASEEEPV